MIKAELIHNPYLLITKVKFNEQEPKINSQIEKYENQPLRDWVTKVPRIFYDEMNGYDFDFYFTGTVPDFDSVKTAFEKAGVTSEQVRLFHKNEIEDSETKCAEIEKLLEWMKCKPNRNFDFDGFRDKNEELFAGGYPFIIVGRKTPENMGMSISPESVASVKELASTNLSSTPILFYIEEDRREQLRMDLLTLLSRNDIQQEQLFFMIDSEMNIDQVTRVIIDLGVINPQVVDRYDAEEILDYVRNYPITEYVRKVITVISSEVEKINEILENEKKDSAVINEGIHHKIDELDMEISSLKEADEFFVQRDNYEIPHQFAEARQALIDQLLKWKNRKTKVVGDSESTSAANEYSNYIDKAMTAFENIIFNLYHDAALTIDNEFSDEYKHAGIDVDYKPDGIVLTENADIVIPELVSEFLEMKEITYEELKNDFFGLLKKSSDESSEPVRVVTCYLDQWRSKAKEMISPLVDDWISKYFLSLIKYYDEMAEKYHAHLVEVLENKTRDKDTVSSQLSDDEKRFQEDNDWLIELKDQLQNIERG